MTFIFRENIAEDIKIFRQADQFKYSTKLFYFYPLSHQDRRVSLLDYLEKMKAYQQSISKSLVSKHFMDFSESIVEVEKEIKNYNLEVFFREDELTFSTAKYNTVIAHPQISTESLFALASLIDETFPESESLYAVYVVDIDSAGLVVGIFLEENSHVVEKHRYTEFINKVSKDAFEGEPVTLQIKVPDSDSDLTFKSKSTKDS